MNRLKKIWIVKLIVILIVLASCSGADDDTYEESYNPVVEEEKKELTLRDQFNPLLPGDRSNDRLIEIYDHLEEETGLSINSDSKALDGYISILKNELSRGDLPDIIQINLMYDDGSGDGKSFLHEEKENLLDLTDFLEESGLMEKFYSLDNYTVDGRVYGLPIDGNTMQLYYNKALVEELGGIPETFEDFISIMKEAKNKGYNPIAIDEEDGFSQMPYDLFQGILLETAGREKLYELMNGEASWFDDEFIAALQFMEEIAQLEIPRLEMYLDGLYNEFLSGNIVFMYSFFAPDEDNFGVMPFPTVSSSHENSPSLIANFPSGYVFNGNVSEEEEQLIYKFIETLWSEEFISTYYTDKFYIPAIHVEANTEDALFNEVLQMMNETTNFVPKITDLLPYTKGSNFSQVNYEIRTREVVKDLANGELSSQEAVEKMDEIQENVVNITR